MSHYEEAQALMTQRLGTWLVRYIRKIAAERRTYLGQLDELGALLRCQHVLQHHGEPLMVRAADRQEATRDYALSLWHGCPRDEVCAGVMRRSRHVKGAMMICTGPLHAGDVS